MTDTAEASAPDDRRRSLLAQLVTAIRDIIIRGEIADGARSPEAALCQRFAVSRTPLREALKSLASEGLVTLRPNRGAVVAPLDLSERLASHNAAAARAILARIGDEAAERPKAPSAPGRRRRT